ncbi:MAG: hypothetical protein HY235_18600 [Acidobacteria bacterium]|nr:hypothetical protein [Acidobacteriota bacterium]
MSRKLSFSLALLCALLMSSPALARNVFVAPPGDGVPRPVAQFAGDPFASGALVSAAQDTFLVLSTPSGNKFYFIGRSFTDTVVVTDSSFNVIARRNLGTGATAAAMSPDGRYLVVTAGTVQIIRTVDDVVVTSVDGGFNPNDVAISRDGQRAFVTSNASARLTSIDLNSFSIIGTLQSLGPVNGVAVGPNGMVYVSATNILYEVDPRDLSFRGGAGISLNAQPGKPYVVGDGFGNLRVVMVNLNPAFGGSSLITVDLGTRTFTPLFASGLVLDRLIPVSSNRVIATSQTLQLYDISLPSFLQAASFSGLGTASNIRAAVASNEFPNARYLYIASTSNTVSRIDLATNALSGSFPLANQPGLLSFAGAAQTGLPNAVYTFNNGQFVAPSAQSLPLLVRAVDSLSRPLAGVPVQYSVGISSAFLFSASSQTDGEGYASAIVIAPATFGQFTVQCNVGSGVVVTATFTLTVGTGTVGPTGAVSVRSGTGQIIRESSITSEVMRVVVRDTAGTPVPNAIVNWTVSTANGPNGTLVQTQTFTDFNGESVNSYIAPLIGPALLFSWIQSTITASTISGSVNLYVTVIPNVILGNPATMPLIQLLSPINIDTITGQAGTTLTGAIQVRVTASSGPQVGQPIPNVGVQASTGLDPTVAPSASCRADTSLTNSSGVATCDLVLGGKTGTAQMTIVVGGTVIGSALTLIVTPGLPAKILPVQGDNQSGPPGASLPVALLARIEDSFGNALFGVPVAWVVESGSATLLNTINRSDNLARVSTLLRLGNIPGTVRIRVTAQGGLSSATAVFTATVNITATQLRRVSGDGQSAIVNQPFTEALVAQVLDANNAGVQGIQVTFSVRGGSANIATPFATSDVQGFVRTNVTAGGTAGPVTITAEFSGLSVSWSLTVRPLGPTIPASGFVNAATGQPGSAPGSIATIRGSNIAPTVRGYVLPPNDSGPRPTTLAGVSVAFGGVAAPIFWVANIDGQESLTVQVPFEAPENSTVPLTVTASGTSATVNVAIAAYAPGLFENTDSVGRRYAVITRADGSFVTPDNPIGRGERGRAYVTGMGRVRPQAFTNAYGGVNQEVMTPVVVGINDAGVQLISAEYAQNLIGVYIVTFVVPLETTVGVNRNFVVAIDAGGGNLIFSNGSTIAIR